MKNIIIAGVGGQGLVLTTDMICEVAFKAGFDVKSNDVIGLSQRGGKVWGSVRFGETVHTPNIAEGEADVLIALEPLEGLRWQSFLKPGGVALMNSEAIYPVFAITESAPYPHDFEMQMRQDIKCVVANVQDMAIEVGTPKIVNVIMLGMLAKYLEIDKSFWVQVIREKAPAKFLEMNLTGFERGYNI